MFISSKITWSSWWFTIFTWEDENWKSKKLVANRNDETEWAIHIRNLKQASNQGLVLKKVHRVIMINFNQNTWLKPYIEMNSDLKKSKKWF